MSCSGTNANNNSLKCLLDDNKTVVNIEFITFIDESGSDSDGAESTSSSYSSLSDFVLDIQNSDINGETPG